MKQSVFAALVLLCGCGVGADYSMPFGSYVSLNAQPDRLSSDFNARSEQVRLLFIVGPTCGGCLAVMADYQEEFVASLQDDERIHTFVVHVPTLGAQEEHVPSAMSLLDGPRVSHYWNGTGKLGSDYSATLDIGDTYAWDVWMLYPPGVTWADGPPMPAYWQQNIGVERANPIDAPAFAAEVNRNADRINR